MVRLVEDPGRRICEHFEIKGQAGPHGAFGPLSSLCREFDGCEGRDTKVGLSCCSSITYPVAMLTKPAFPPKTPFSLYLSIRLP